MKCRTSLKELPHGVRTLQESLSEATEDFTCAVFASAVLLSDVLPARPRGSVPDREGMRAVRQEVRPRPEYGVWQVQQPEVLLPIVLVPVQGHTEVPHGPGRWRGHAGAPMGNEPGSRPPTVALGTGSPSQWNAPRQSSGKPRTLDDTAAVRPAGRGSNRLHCRALPGRRAGSPLAVSSNVAHWLGRQIAAVLQ